MTSMVTAREHQNNPNRQHTMVNRFTSQQSRNFNLTLGVNMAEQKSNLTSLDITF